MLRRCFGLVMCVALLAAAECAYAQSIVATVPLSDYRQAVAFNPATNKIYALAEPANELVEIDGRTHRATIIPLGPTPEKSLNGVIRVNSRTNTIYVVNVTSNNVAVVDGRTHAVTFVTAGRHPVALEINLKTNTVYATNGGSNSVTVIDAATMKTTTVATGVSPGPMANPVTNRIRGEFRRRDGVRHQRAD